jgi:hypothetical protein
LPIDDEVGFKDALEYCIELGSSEYYKLSKNAFNYGKRISNSKSDIDSLIQLFK